MEGLAEGGPCIVPEYASASPHPPPHPKRSFSLLLTPSHSYPPQPIPTTQVCSAASPSRLFHHPPPTPPHSCLLLSPPLCSSAVACAWEGTFIRRHQQHPPSFSPPPFPSAALYYHPSPVWTPIEEQKNRRIQHCPSLSLPPRSPFSPIPADPRFYCRIHMSPFSVLRM